MSSEEGSVSVCIGNRYYILIFDKAAGDIIIHYHNGEPIHRLLGAKRRAQAEYWLKGYQQGLEHGRSNGISEAQCVMRNALGIKYQGGMK